MNFNQSLLYFKNNYNGRKLSFYLTGGGICITDFLKMPGAGKFIHGIYIPYSEEANLTLIENFHGKLSWNYPFASKECNELYDEVLKNINKDDRILRVITSCALTTTRYRRGDNKAFISFNGKVWKLSLKKLEEKEHLELVEKQKASKEPIFMCIDTIRYREDEKVGQAILYVITEDDVLKPALEAEESLERVN